MGIVDFFANKNVLVTGGTGFLGKLLVLKLLTSCPDIGMVYLVLRPRKKKPKRVGASSEDSLKKSVMLSPEERLSGIIKTCPLFDDVRTSNPDVLLKIKVVHGDLLAEDLGLKASVKDVLVKEVNVVFHLAATVKFDEPLSNAWSVNVQGTRSLLRLSETMPHLLAFIHCSTAFVQCFSDPQKGPRIIEEKIYKEEELLKFNYKSNPERLCGRHNTYTFSKAAAEQLLWQHRQQQLKQLQNCRSSCNKKLLPVAVVRPSIVIATWKEPFAGWIENFNGPTGMLVTMSTGIMRSIYIHYDKRCDLVPADSVVNLLIAAAFNLGSTKSIGFLNKKIPVYQLTSGLKNPIIWQELLDNMVSWLPVNPMAKMGRFPSFTTTKSKTVHNINRFFFHSIPAWIFDNLYRRIILRKKPFLGVIYKKIDRSCELLEMFANGEWTWTNSNSDELLDSLCQEDRDNFNFDIASLDWNAYMGPYLLGMRNFVLGHAHYPMADSRKKYQRLKIMHGAMRLILVLFLAGCILYTLFHVKRYCPAFQNQ